MGGLCYDIKEKVKLQPVRFLSEAISFAETVEEMINIRTKNMRRKSTWETSSSKNPNYFNKASDQPSTSLQGKGKEVDTQELNSEKRKETANRSKSQNNYTHPSLGKCFRCGQTGHLSNTCPQQKTIALADEEEDSKSENSKDAEEEVELIEADNGDRVSCILQRVLLAPREERDPQRHSRFKTRCTINGKVCDVIIDSGSSENSIAKKLVANLNMKAKPHPNPYKIGWVKKGGEAMVNEICTVPLSIGSEYKDQTICDVIEMNVCMSHPPRKALVA